VPWLGEALIRKAVSILDRTQGALGGGAQIIFSSGMHAESASPSSAAL